MKYPLANQPQYKVQHYLGKTVGEMLLDPTAQYLLGGISSSSAIYKAAASKLPSDQFILFENSSSAEVGRINFTASDTFIGLNSGKVITGSTVGNVGLGANALASLTTGSDNIGIGSGALQDITTNRQNVAIGSNAGRGMNSRGNVLIGIVAGFVEPGATMGDFNTLVGGETGDINAGGSIGAANIALGVFSLNGTPVIGDNNIFIGNSIGGLAGISNSIMIGSNMGSISLSNIIMLGNTTHNVFIGGDSSTLVDNGNKLQISGKLNTGGAAPLTAGAGTWDFGKLKTAASALSTTHYLEVSVDGVLYKVCIN